MSAEAAPPQTLPKAKVFISYSRKDMAFADLLEGALKARGFEPLIDRTEIYAFEDWWKRIQALIGRADTVVFVLSPDAVASDVALKEVTYAASLNKRFAPIVCQRVADGAIPEALRRLNFIFFDDAARFEASADRLAEALQTDIGWVRQHTEFGEAARRWALADRPNGLLLRSPVLEEAERWIASRPRGAPEPTADTRAYIVDSRRGATRRRNILTGSLAAGLVVALALAAVAYWQRTSAVEQRQIAEQQRKRAEDTLAAATKTANGLVFDLAQRFKESVGVPAALVKDILDKARALQEQLVKSGQVTPELQGSEAAALTETADALLAIGDTQGALAAAEQARQIMADLVTAAPTDTRWRDMLWVSQMKIGNVLRARGDLGGALASYRESLAVIDRLAKSDPSNADWQHDLSVAYEKIGYVQEARATLPAHLCPIVTALPSGSDWRNPIPATPFGSASSQCRTTRSAMYSGRGATLPARWRLTAKASPSGSGWRNPIPATPSGSTVCRCRMRRLARCRYRKATLPARWRPTATASLSQSG